MESMALIGLIINGEYRLVLRTENYIIAAACTWVS